MLIRRQRPARTRLARAARPCFARPVLTGLAAAGTALLALLGFWVLLAPAATAGPGEATFAGDSNALRSAHGHAGYRVCPDLTAIADQWAAHLAATGTLAHNAELPTQMTHWASLGENVGEGSNVAVVQGALVVSPPHLANLLSATFTEAGYGTAVDTHGTLWVDEVFRQPAGAPCPGGSTPESPLTPTTPSAAPTVATTSHASAVSVSAAATARADLMRGLNTASRSTTVRSPADLALVARRHLAAALAVAPDASDASDPVGQAFAYFGTVTRVVR